MPDSDHGTKHNDQLRQVSPEEYAKIVALEAKLGLALQGEVDYSTALMALSLLTAKVIMVAENSDRQNYLDPVLNNIRLMRADMRDSREDHNANHP